MDNIQEYNNYPQDLTADLAQLSRQPVDVAFIPTQAELYPQFPGFIVKAPDNFSYLEGAARPQHFGGVSTVLTKLFNIIKPKAAVFGKKDYQQFLLVRNLVRDFNLPIEIIPAETYRTKNGLALSSRNRLLTSAEKKLAPLLFAELKQLKTKLIRTPADRTRLIKAAKLSLAAAGFKVDYIELCHKDYLQNPPSKLKNGIILSAVKLGQTRLIDNIEIEPTDQLK